MCRLCTLPTVSKKSLKTDYDITLSYIGSKRRNLIHKNRVRNERKTLKDSVRDAEWRAVEIKKQKSEQGLKRDLRDLFEEQIQTLVDRLKTKAGQKVLNWGRKRIKQEEDEEEEEEIQAEVSPLIVSVLLDWTEWFQRTRDTAEPQVENIAEEGFEAALQRIGSRGPDFSSRRPAVRTTLDQILDQAARTQDTFRQVTARTIQRGLREGDSMPQIVRRVANKTQEQVGFRLDRIVQTAANGAFERGQRQAFLDAGISIIDWLTQRDPRVRDPVIGDLWSHRDADGQEIEIDQQFRLTGRGGREEFLWHPGDPDGSPGNVIYCRCTITAVR